MTCRAARVGPVWFPLRVSSVLRGLSLCVTVVPAVRPRWWIALGVARSLLPGRAALFSCLVGGCPCGRRFCAFVVGGVLEE